MNNTGHDSKQPKTAMQLQLDKAEILIRTKRLTQLLADISPDTALGNVVKQFFSKAVLPWLESIDTGWMSEYHDEEELDRLKDELIKCEEAMVRYDNGYSGQ